MRRVRACGGHGRGRGVVGAWRFAGPGLLAANGQDGGRVSRRMVRVGRHDRDRRGRVCDLLRSRGRHVEGLREVAGAAGSRELPPGTPGRARCGRHGDARRDRTDADAGVRRPMATGKWWRPSSARSSRSAWPRTSIRAPSCSSRPCRGHISARSIAGRCVDWQPPSERALAAARTPALRPVRRPPLRRPRGFETSTLAPLRPDRYFGADPPRRIQACTTPEQFARASRR